VGTARGTEPSRWLAAAVDQCVWAEWGGNFAVFHRPSGQTHFLNSATALLLRQVLLHPRDVEGAARALAAELGIASSPEYVSHLAELLARLEEMGLVSRVPA
jgi:PqqD family protein of HPr-rel-A system